MQKQQILRMELHASDGQHAAAALAFVGFRNTTLKQQKSYNKKAETTETSRNLDGRN